MMQGNLPASVESNDDGNIQDLHYNQPSALTYLHIGATPPLSCISQAEK